MGSREDQTTQTARELYVLSDRIEELHRTHEELKQAKDEAMQSWLDSKPLIDELETLKTDLANAKQTYSDETLVANLESELNAINTDIRAKKEEDLKLRTEINELNRALEMLKEDLKRIELENYEGKRTRLKMKQVVKLRRQSLRRLKLTLRAVRLESEAYGASCEATVHQTVRATMDQGSMVELTQEDYFALTRRAKEETSLADWRVVAANEQRRVAEESRDLGLKRLMELSSFNGGLTKNEEIVEIEGLGVGLSARNSYPKAREKVMDEGTIKSGLKRRRIGKKKRSIFVEIRSFFAKKIKYLFR